MHIPKLVENEPAIQNARLEQRWHNLGVGRVGKGGMLGRREGNMEWLDASAFLTHSSTKR